MTNLSVGEAWSNLGVLRVMFSVCLFHVFLGLVMIGVKSSRDARAGLQNGLWVVKLLLLSGIMIGAFFIKNTFFIGIRFLCCDSNDIQQHGLGSVLLVHFYLSWFNSFSWLISRIHGTNPGSEKWRTAHLVPSGVSFPRSLFYMEAPLPSQLFLS